MFPSKVLDLELSPSTSRMTKDTPSPLSDIHNSFFGTEQLQIRPFYSYQKEQMRRELREEIDEDGDHIMTECNRLISQISEQSQSQPDLLTKPPKQNLDDLFSLIAITQQPRSSISSEQENNNKKFTGRLKFFDEPKNYGFLVMDMDGSDIFVYADDLVRTGLSKEYLRTAKQGNLIRFTFTCMNYVGKYNQSRKAIDLEYLKPQLMVPSPLQMGQYLPFLPSQLHKSPILI